MSSRLKDALPFHVFARRGQVLTLYKKMRRCVRHVKGGIELQQALRTQIIQGFQHNKSVADNVAIRQLMQEANQQLKQLESMCDNENNEDSWLSGGDKDDERGRVGTGWPWGRS